MPPRGRGRGGWGNPYPFCRRYPWLPRWWWSYPGYAYPYTWYRPPYTWNVRPGGYPTFFNQAYFYPGWGPAYGSGSRF
jgi:hypothetical protein